MLFVTFLLASPTRHTACLCAVAKDPLSSLSLYIHLGLSASRAIISIVLCKVFVLFFGRDEILPTRQGRLAVLLIIPV